MSVEDGTVSDRELAVAQEWFRAKGVDLTCPMCKRTNFTAMAHFVTPMQMFGEYAALDGIRYPMFGVVCTNCGHVSLFSAIAMGFYERSNASGAGIQASAREGK